MSEEPTFETENVTDTEQLIADIEALISRIKLLRIHIAMYLLSTEVSPLWGETSDDWSLFCYFRQRILLKGIRGRHGGTAPTRNQCFWDYWTDALGKGVRSRDDFSTWREKSGRIRRSRPGKDGARDSSTVPHLPGKSRTPSRPP